MKPKNKRVITKRKSVWSELLQAIAGALIASIGLTIGGGIIILLIGSLVWCITGYDMLLHIHHFFGNE